MATAYAAIVSLIHLIEQIPAHHARRPTIFSEKQLGEIKSLKEKASYIQHYLEISHSLIDSNEAQDLKIRIVDASYTAADVIELHIVDDIMDQEKEETACQCAEAILHVYEVIQKVMQGVMCFITNKMKEIKGLSEIIQTVMQDMDFITNKMKEEIEGLQPNNLSHVDHSWRPITTTIDHDALVGLDDRLTQTMDKLTGQQSTLQIIPITGMGGIGKTTLARNVYGNSLIVQHFDIRGWITTSQVYKIEQIFLDLLRQFGVTIAPKEQEQSEYHHLGLTLHQHLTGRKYLIIVDDLWDIDAWDKLKLFLPDYTNGSRIMVTTRLKDIADKVGSTNLQEINLLDENKSWTLLCQKTFGQENCPRPELEEIGKKIAKQCKGLPLSIAVIGGILVKSNMMPESWEYVADNINKTISSDDSNCMDILLLSYRHLPIHLQPCFLYMGVYPEDKIIRVSELINMWVAEGFLKPIKLKTLEEVAEEYLKDLTQRYLIIVNEWGSLGTMKSCKIHDLLRDLCLQEAHKEKFYFVNKMDKIQNSSQFTIEHRITIQHDAHVSRGSIEHASQSTILVRSLTCNLPLEFSHIPNFKLLRVYNLLNGYSNEVSLLNLRCNIIYGEIHGMHRLWNLQTLVIAYRRIEPNYKFEKFQIWKMPHLRHLICTRSSSIYIPNTRHGQIDDSVLENLQTLSCIQRFKCTEEVVRRIPNVKKLVIAYNTKSNEIGPDYYLNNIGLLNKLQSLTLKLESHYSYTYGTDFIQNCVFPPSLKKLVLNAMGNYFLEDIITRIGWLPHLEKLNLKYVCVQNEWNPIEGQFLRLKVFKLEHWLNLKFWNADSSHFPVLEHLHVIDMSGLEEIPSGIGEIETLQSITLLGCKASVVESAKNILEEQQSLGNEDFRLAYSYVIFQ